ncbi:hypothetical protein HHI36_011606 [Cryptolaemus montrouzieri]|uniref:Uncharacterized protein n=1 Tax=Cryptolaemus montrouzieri TaxID=559131 RepID=A0ABD2MM49_9CUCU
MQMENCSNNFHYFSFRRIIKKNYTKKTCYTINNNELSERVISYFTTKRYLFIFYEFLQIECATILNELMIRDVVKLKNYSPYGCNSIYKNIIFLLIDVLDD